MPDIRFATADDAPFLEAMLAVASDWRPDAPPRPVSEILAIPNFAHYVSGWPRDGDLGVVAEEAGEPLGAAWWRLLTAEDPGYGYVDDATPEVSIGVRAEARGQGIGRRLLERLVDAARERGLGALSLSVEADNPAARLYARLGFRVVGGDAGAPTMVLTLGGGGS